MKNLILAFAFFLSAASVCAQSCADGWLPFTEGMTYEQTHYNKKGKIESYMRGEILSVTAEDGKSVALIEADFVDKKGKDIQSDLQTKYICDGEGYEFDMSGLLSQLPLDGVVEIETSRKKLVYPMNMNVGDELPNGGIDFTVNAGIMQINGEVRMRNRRVAGKETISVPAGDFDTVKITYDLETTVFGNTRNEQVTEWMARGIGAVKSEHRSEGDLNNYMELTKLSK